MKQVLSRGLREAKRKGDALDNDSLADLVWMRLDGRRRHHQCPHAVIHQPHSHYLTSSTNGRIVP
jgi:hypothetical protein